MCKEFFEIHPAEQAKYLAVLRSCAPEKLYLVNLKYVIEKTALTIENTCFLACLTTG